MKRRTILLTATYPMVAALPRSGAETQDSAARSTHVRVLAVDAKNRTALGKARVFVLTQDGRQVAEARAGDDGIAVLPPLPEEVRGKYVLVECPWYFIVGREWTPGQLEYYMPLMALTPPGFSG
jgi:hypothetical protein